MSRPRCCSASTAGGVSETELSELLARDLLIPVLHETTWAKVREVSPLLASRNGLDTADDSMKVIAIKIAELVAVEDTMVTVWMATEGDVVRKSARRPAGPGAVFAGSASDAVPSPRGRLRPSPSRTRPVP